MGTNPNKQAICPSARLQIYIDDNADIRFLQHSIAPKRILTIDNLQMIAACSKGDIVNLKKSLTDFFDIAGFNAAQRERSTTLAKNLLRQDRLEKRSIVAADLVPAPSSLTAQIPSGPLVLCTPCTFRVRDGSFEVITHDGKLLPPVSAVELHALSQLVKHDTVAKVLAAHKAIAGNIAIDKEQFLTLLGPFVAHRFIVERKEETGKSLIELSGFALHGDTISTTHDVFRRHAEAQDAAESERVAVAGRPRPRVIPVAFDVFPPAGLAAVVAYAKVYEDGALEEFYEFRTDWVWDPARLEFFTREPAIYMFTNYLWSHKECIDTSAQIKKLSPSSITIHGGPDTPKYEKDQLRHFAENPHVDIIVRGEGEISGSEVLSKLRQVIGDAQPDLNVLKDVQGVTYRTPDGIERNADAPRVKDLDELPSAYLTGLFDPYMGLEGLYVILETNRGCPYGCTFCDWGSATASKIRKFDIDRVMKEIEWTSQAKAAFVSIADANFGIFPRDVDIARKAADLKNKTGYPRGFGGNYAKNTVAHLRKIIDVLTEGDILTLGTLSLQSMDEGTLDAINRANIKTEKYDALAVEMRSAGLPLTVELMMGLPGSTLHSFREDLQQCIDRELPVRVNLTTLLVNSPMNAPEYLEKHEIRTRLPVSPGNQALLCSTSSYTEDDMALMELLRSGYMLFENYGVLRIISRFVSQETSLTEMHFYEKLLFDSKDHHAWPMLHLLCYFVSSHMAAPVSWSLVMEELARYLQQELALADTAARRSALAAQLACLPAHDRVYPATVELECDVVAWHNAILAAKEQGNRKDWAEAVPPLGSYREGALTVDDPMGLTEDSLGISNELNALGITWELDSPLHRARADFA